MGGPRYTYNRYSNTHLKLLRTAYSHTLRDEDARPHDMDLAEAVIDYITEILELRREVRYWRSLTPAKFGGDG